MSTNNYNTNQNRSFTHLDFKERQLIEKWLNEDISKAEIGRRLGRNRSTIHREINRGTVEQIKQINGYNKKVTVYYSDSGQSVYENRRLKFVRKKIVSFSSAFFSALEDAFTKGLFKGKQRLYNIKTFIALYRKKHPVENIPTFKTVYSYIRQGLLSIKPHDLPVMYRLKPRKNKHSNPKGKNKRILGTSITDRPEDVLSRETFGHWEADLVKGKKTKNEPAIITLVERKTRYAITKKISDYKSQTVKNAFEEILADNPNLFASITFDNGSEFSLMSELNTDVYFCHAYASWERGSNENFNKLLREFIPKGKSIHLFSEMDIDQATQAINKRIREVIGLRSSEEYFQQCRI